MSRGGVSSRIVGAVLGLVCLLSLGGCGSSGTGRTGTSAARSPAAEPAHDPHRAAHIAGHSVRVGPDPQGIAVESATGRVAVATHTGRGTIVVLDASGGRVLARIPITSAARHLGVAGPRGPILVPEERANRLLELDLADGRGLTVATGAFPHDATVLGKEVVVGNERGRSLTLAPLASRSTRRIGGFVQPGGVAAVRGRIAVVDVAAFSLSLVDPRTGRILTRLPAGAGPSHDVATGNRIYVADTRGGELITYSAVPFRRLGSTRLPDSPYGLALDPVHRRLWVTETGANRLDELSLRGRLPRVIASFATGRQPDTVAVDPGSGRVFVANQVDGTVQVIDPGPAR